MDKVFSSLPDLINQPISHPDNGIDGNSFVWDGTHFAGYTDLNHQ
jgi:hypothetical protein